MPAFLSIPAALFVVVVAAAHVATAQVTDIFQLDYVDPATGDLAQPDSRVFRIEVDFDSSDPAQQQLLAKNGGGYLNVFVRLDPSLEPDWVVQNDFESFENAADLDNWLHSYTVGFVDLVNVPGGIYIGELEVATFIGPEPLVKIRPPWKGLIFLPFLVNNEQWAGDNGAPSEDQEEPADDPTERDQAGPYVGNGENIVARGRTLVSPRNFPLVNERKWECTPASYARGIKYLSMIYPERFNPPDGDVVFDRLKFECDTNDANDDVLPNDDQEGTLSEWGNIHPAMDGRDRVNDIENFPLQSTFDEFKFDPNEPGFPNLIVEIQEKLNRGVAVQMDIGRSNDTNHTVNVLQIDTIQHSPSLQEYRIDFLDQNQDEEGLIQPRVKRIICNENGRFRYNEGNFSQDNPNIVLGFGIDEFFDKADFNRDRKVDGADQGLLLAAWGLCQHSPCPGDLNKDGIVNGTDLGLLLAAWGEVVPIVPDD